MATMTHEHPAANVELQLTLRFDGDAVADAELAAGLEHLLTRSRDRLRLVVVTRVDPAPVVASALVEPLTMKEREVLGHLSELLTTEEIASAMFVSINTVRTHVRNILRKLAVSRRNEAVRRARALRLLEA